MNTNNTNMVEEDKLEQAQAQSQESQQKIVFLKWTCEGCEPPQRSERIKKRQPYIANDETLVDARFIKELEVSAYSNALNHDENTWNMLNNSLASKNN
jgi:hypothetical protein